jgi:glyoxylase-like metal-dependent hydrolase (beta-lactamase superfamily II)
MIKKFGNVVLISLSDFDSNIYLIGSALIDAGTGFNFIRLRDLLKILQKQFGDITQVINTHGHFDHIGGNGFFSKAKILIHRNDAPIVETADVELSAADYFDGKIRPKRVDTKLEGNETLSLDGSSLEVIHTPGHTLGSVCLYDRKSQSLFTGDTVFENAIGRVDFPNSDLKAMQASLDRLRELKVKTVFPGHGKPFDGKALDRVLRTNVEQFQAKIDEGEVDEDYV